MKLKNYLHSQFSLTFFPIFLALFFITSIVFLVKIASLTSVITLDFIELFKLYSYSLPQIIFYTLPVVFFISLAITLSKLSSESELTVITSFGLNPLKILKIFLPITFFASILLLFVSLALIPKSKFLTKQFLEYKKYEAKFNIKDSEFGQKFGDWLVYINGKDEDVFKEINLFKNDAKKDEFIISKEAVLESVKGHLSLKLIDGKVYTIDENELNEIDYEIMYINDSIADSKDSYFEDSLVFWKSAFKENKDMDDFAFFTLTSIFPLISLFLVIVFGYFNPRYEKNRAVFLSVLAVVIYYILIKYIGDRLLLHSLYIIPLSWLIISYIIYSRTIKKEY